MEDYFLVAVDTEVADLALNRHCAEERTCSDLKMEVCPGKKGKRPAEQVQMAIVVQVVQRRLEHRDDMWQARSCSVRPPDEEPQEGAYLGDLALFPWLLGRTLADHRDAVV